MISASQVLGRGGGGFLPQRSTHCFFINPAAIAVPRAEPCLATRRCPGQHPAWQRGGPHVGRAQPYSRESRNRQKCHACNGNAFLVQPGLRQLDGEMVRGEEAVAPPLPMKNAPEAEPQLVRDRPLHPAATANAERTQGRTSIGVKQAAALFFFRRRCDKNHRVGLC